jgi:hypothetical protein
MTQTTLEKNLNNAIKTALMAFQAHSTACEASDLKRVDIQSSSGFIRRNIADGSYKRLASLTMTFAKTLKTAALHRIPVTVEALMPDTHTATIDFMSSNLDAVRKAVFVTDVNNYQESLEQLSLICEAQAELVDADQKFRKTGTVVPHPAKDFAP